MLDTAVPMADRAVADRAVAACSLRGRVTARSMTTALIVAAPAVLLAVMGYRYRWLADDGDIAMRVVRQILAGHGPVFNIGDRVEVGTSALWVWLLAAVAFVTRLGVYTVALLTSLLLAPAGLLLAADGTRRLLGGAGEPARWLIPAGSLVVAALPPFWEFTTSGLESPLIFFWLGLSWWLLVRLRPESSGLLPCAAVFTWGLGWLVRPDMAVASACFIVAGYLVLRPAAPRSALLAAIAFALPAGYQLFRMGYYAEIVPNTAVDKSAGSLVPGRGWAYLLNYGVPYQLWIPALLMVALAVVCLAAGRLPRNDQVKIAAVLIAGLLMTGYVVAIGGDFMHARMLLPPTFTLLLPAMVVPLPGLAVARRAIGAAALAACLAVWALACAGLLRLPHANEIDATGFVDERAFWTSFTGDGHPTSPAPFLYGGRGLLGGSAAHPDEFARMVRGVIRSGVPVFIYMVHGRPRMTAPLRSTAGAPVAANGILLGRLGAGLPLSALVIDDKGLAYPLASHLLIRTHGRPGHEKTISLAWELADYTPLWYTSARVKAAELAAARAALRCGELARFMNATRAPLTWDQFWSNVVHAYSYTRMVIPPDATKARHQFCG